MKSFKLSLTVLSLALLAGCNAASPIVQIPTAPASLSRMSASATGSNLHFDASQSEVQQAIHSKGLNKPGYRQSIVRADLVYSNDGWKTTKTAAIQYLRDNTQGFVLAGVAPGTAIEYAVHAWIGNSYDNFRSYETQTEVWINNNSRNYQTTTK